MDHDLNPFVATRKDRTRLKTFSLWGSTFELLERVLSAAANRHAVFERLRRAIDAEVRKIDEESKNNGVG